MAILRLSAARAALERVPRFVSEHHGAVVLDCVDADTVVCAAALKDQWTCATGVWLEVSPGYPAQMCARDIKTLSWLIDLENVVVSAPMDARAHAEVVRALLTNDEVNFSNDVATIVGAYNRPAPTRTVRIWSSDTRVLESEGVVLTEHSVTRSEIGELTSYA
ncbi:MAG: hypothetical protein HIU84_13545 [Acidobacteria bacterium]|nr:hypothetical protein [Acidobacteriota bacterium]